MSNNVLFTWSGGKDSVLALYTTRQSHQYAVTALLTTVTEGYDRISMHGVPTTLLEQQANSLGIPLKKILITQSATNEAYERAMKEVLSRYQANGTSTVVFGDIFLEDLRTYREQNLAKIGMEAVFPLWKRDTRELAETFIRLGFQAIVTCVDSQALGGAFAGRFFDEEFLSDLPQGVDPCGENGEFHSFVFDGPLFQEPILFEKGEIVLRDERFWFCDLVPG
jgi:uncharacterized protein (TIGR00290 family)